MSQEFDHLLVEIRKNLHDARGSRAAVMVGAGFSRNSVPLNAKAKQFPSWSDLVARLVEQLYPKSEQKDVINRAGETSAALRLAQEYEAAFGRSALIELVRAAIPDDAFQPGMLHRRLLELPWNDVFTTNYDCQLEKASQWVWRRQYSVVRGTEDLPVARSPRIVKLHGTLPDLSQMVLTEDDFRIYPRRSAPFVNLVGTSLAANSFCLIGFSGNDPNFLAWTGWVRDELRHAAPSIYLFTCSTHPLKHFQRRLLESRNVIPIDLLDRYDTADPGEAHNSLLTELRELPGAKVPSWNTSRRYAISRFDSSIAKEPLFPHSDSPNEWREAEAIWSYHRRLYRGWVILPRSAADRLSEDVSIWMSRYTPKLTSGWDLADRIRLIYELVWRCDTSSTPLYDNFVFQAVDPLLGEYDSSASKLKAAFGSHSESGTSRELKEKVEYLQLQCLRHAREIGNDERFTSFELAFAPNIQNPKSSDERLQFLQYQKILRSLGRLEQHNAREMLSSWHTEEADPIWSVRRAGLCLECGLFQLAEQLLDECLARIRQIPVEPNDYRILSTEGSLLYLRLCALQSRKDDEDELEISQSTRLLDVNEREITDRLNDLNAKGCDPYDSLDWLKDVTEYRPQKRLGTYEEEQYDVGRISRHTTFGDDKPVQRAYQSIRFLEDSGLPLRIARRTSIDISEVLFRNAAMMIARNSTHEAIGSVLRSRDVKLVKELFSRSTMAHLTTQQISFLYSAAIEALRAAVTHLGIPPSPRTDVDTWWERQLEIACILLDRVTALLTQDNLKAILKEILPLSWDPRLMGRVNGFDDLNNVIRRCCELFDSKSVSEILPILIESPLLGSGKLPRGAFRVGQRENRIGSLQASIKWSDEEKRQVLNRIDELIERVEHGANLERTDAVERLTTLDDFGCLSDRQRQFFSQALYAKVDEFGMPIETTFLPSFLVLKYPTWSPEEIVIQFRQAFVDKELNDGNIWRSLKYSVSRFGSPREKAIESVKWSSNDLDNILSKAEKWISDIGPSSDDLSEEDENIWATFRKHDTIKERKYFRACLETIEEVVLLSESLNDSQLQKAISILETTESLGHSTLLVMPTLCQRGKYTSEEIVEQIKYGLASSDEQLVLFASSAMVRWAELTRAGFPHPIPSRCYLDLGLLILEGRHERLPLFLNVAEELFALLGLAVDQSFQSDVLTGIRRLLPETDYSKSRSRWTVNQRIHLRKIALKLVKRLRRLDVKHAAIDEWLQSGMMDCFEDVRRLCHD